VVVTRGLVNAAFVLAVGLPLSASPFTNGSFETNAGGGCNPGGNFVELGVGSTCITGWSVVSGNIDYVGGLWQAENGNDSIDMDGNTDGAIAQTFDTILGNVYSVSFYLAGNTNAAPTVKTLQVSATSGTPQTYTFNDTGFSNSNMGYILETYSFTAGGTSTTLTFTSLDNPSSNAGAVIDNVSVTDLSAAPEPGTLALVLGAVGLMALYRWKRRSQPQGSR
jgi:choice-of-anchor C domain-containing protein